jgi:hypothetical protein
VYTFTHMVYADTFWSYTRRTLRTRTDSRNAYRSLAGKMIPVPPRTASCPPARPCNRSQLGRAHRRQRMNLPQPPKNERKYSSAAPRQLCRHIQLPSSFGHITCRAHEALGAMARLLISGPAIARPAHGARYAMGCHRALRTVRPLPHILKCQCASTHVIMQRSDILCKEIEDPPKDPI